MGPVLGMRQKHPARPAWLRQPDASIESDEEIERPLPGVGILGCDQGHEAGKLDSDADGRGLKDAYNLIWMPKLMVAT